MRAIFIDAHAKTVAAIEHSGNLAGMYQTLKCTNVECVSAHGSIDIWIDGEGAINGARVGFGFAGLGPFHGSGLLLCADADGDCVSCGLPVEIARAMTRFAQADPD